MVTVKMPALGISGTHFTLAGRPANDGHLLRGVSLTGVLLGVEVGGAQTASSLSHVLQRASNAGLDAIAVDLALSSEVDRASFPVANLADMMAAVADSGLVPFVRVCTPRDAWRSIRTDARGFGDATHLANRVAHTSGWVASIVQSPFALVVDLPPGPLNQPETSHALIAAARESAGNGRILVGTRHFSRIREDDPSPDFVFAPRHRRDRRAGNVAAQTDHPIPVVHIGDGADLDDPDGEMGQAVRRGASWFMRVGHSSDAMMELGAPFDALLETVRAAQAAGRAPSDHPTVARADLRHVFRRHADAIRALKLVPANTPGGAPR